LVLELVVGKRGPSNDVFAHALSLFVPSTRHRSLPIHRILAREKRCSLVGHGDDMIRLH
jgi:hypothetical protein